MYQTSLTLMIVLLASLFLNSGVNAQQPSPKSPPIPSALSVPPDQALTLIVSARGVQIYLCKNVADTNKFAWVLKAPEANLFDSDGKIIGKHFAGPSWEALDGSRVVGLVETKVEQEDTIPWLLLSASSNLGVGVFAHTSAIQRVNTAGGKAPGIGCDANRIGNELRVPYTAQYYFYD